MAVVLSPAPTTPAAMEKARNYLAPLIGGATPGTLMAKPDLVERLDAQIAAAAALVEREAPDAPQPVKNEAVVRFCGYLAQSDFGGVVSEKIGPKEATWTTNHAAMFRNSGAKGLLAPFKVRRAGVIG